MTYYAEHIDLSTQASKISVTDYGFYIPLVYGDWVFYNTHMGNCVTSILDATYRVRFPLDWFKDIQIKVYVGDEYWFNNNSIILKVRSEDKYYDCNVSINIADYVDSTSRIDVLGNNMASAPFRMKSDYYCAETNYYFVGGDEFCYKDATCKVFIDVNYNAHYLDTNYRMCLWKESGTQASFRLRYSGNTRYVTRIRFKERKEYGSVYYKFEYMIPDLQVWNLFEIKSARVNDEVVPYWSPILRNPCYANIYRSEEWIDLYVDAVWATEVRMVIYSTEDPFNRTGVEEIGVFEDIVNIWVDAFSVGWIGEYFDATDQTTYVTAFRTGQHPRMEDKPGDEVLYCNSLKLDFVACHSHDDDFVANNLKIYFYPKYLECCASFIMKHKDPYEDIPFFLDCYGRGYEEAYTYMPILSASMAAGDFLLYIPTSNDYNTSTHIWSEDVYVDATCGIYVDKPYKEADIFIPTPGYIDATTYLNIMCYVDATTLVCHADYIDYKMMQCCYNEDSTAAGIYLFNLGNQIVGTNFRLDTMPSAMVVGDFIITHKEPFIDASCRLTVSSLEYLDSTAYIFNSIGVESERISGSFNVGLEIAEGLVGSFVVSKGTVEGYTIGSYNVFGSITTYGAYVHVLTDAELRKLKAVGIFDPEAKSPECE
jgi:hypothetical protein